MYTVIVDKQLGNRYEGAMDLDDGTACSIITCDDYQGSWTDAEDYDRDSIDRELACDRAAWIKSISEPQGVRSCVDILLETQVTGLPLPDT